MAAGVFIVVLQLPGEHECCMGKEVADTVWQQVGACVHCSGSMLICCASCDGGSVVSKRTAIPYIPALLPPPCRSGARVAAAQRQRQLHLLGAI